MYARVGEVGEEVGSNQVQYFLSASRQMKGQDNTFVFAKIK